MMTKLALIATLLACAGCSKSDPNAPKPHWVNSSEYQPYRHWECPDGWTKDYDFAFTRTVRCVSTQLEYNVQEKWQKGLSPK